MAELALSRGVGPCTTLIFTKDHVRPHRGRTRAAVLVPIRPEEIPVGAAWDLTESVGLMREASRRGLARDRVLERSARWAPTRRSVSVSAERGRGVGWAALGYHSGRNARECGGTSLVPAIFTKFMTESLPLCPLLGGGAAKGRGYRTRGGPSWDRGAALGTKGGIPAGLGTRDGISRWP